MNPVERQAKINACISPFLELTKKVGLKNHYGIKEPEKKEAKK